MVPFLLTDGLTNGLMNKRWRVLRSPLNPAAKVCQPFRVRCGAFRSRCRAQRLRFRNEDVYESIYIDSMRVHTVFPVVSSFHFLCICFRSLRLYAIEEKIDRYLRVLFAWRPSHGND